MIFGLSRIELLFICLLAPAFVTASSALAQVVPSPLIDKTLVVWAAPANLTQRGGFVGAVENAIGRIEFEFCKAFPGHR